MLLSETCSLVLRRLLNRSQFLSRALNLIVEFFLKCFERIVCVGELLLEFGHICRRCSGGFFQFLLRLLQTLLKLSRALLSRGKLFIRRIDALFGLFTSRLNLLFCFFLSSHGSGFCATSFFRNGFSVTIFCLL